MNPQSKSVKARTPPGRGYFGSLPVSATSGTRGAPGQVGALALQLPNTASPVQIVILHESTGVQTTEPRNQRQPRRIMATKLDKSLKREVEIQGNAYMLTIDPDGLKLVEKGRRKGLELAWKDLVSGDAALATALNASLEKSSP